MTQHTTSARAISLEVTGGAEDGQRMAGLELSSPPAAVLIVTMDGQIMTQSPAGLETPATLELLAYALEHIRQGGRE